MLEGFFCIMNQEEMKKGREEFLFCIDDLKYALEHVSQKYIRWTIGNDSEMDNQSVEKNWRYCERVFAYELYHQFRLLMCDNERYSDLLFNGEQQKDQSFFKNLFKELQDRKKAIPDLILHENLGNIENVRQVLYIEIKTINNPDVFADLEKLTDLTKTSLNFLYYIFIYVDATIDDLKSKIYGEEYENLDDNILCFCVKENLACMRSILELKQEIVVDKQ